MNKQEKEENKPIEEKNEKFLNIYQRMQAVMRDVKYIQKNSKAAKGLPYKFITHDQVTGALHEAFVNHGIVSTTDIIDFKQDGNRTVVSVLVTFVNTDNPDDNIQIHSFGYGIDTQDKGPGKAISYATKMAYLKCFMLETGEDPEKDNKDYKPEPLTDDEILEIERLIEKIDNFNYERFYKWCQISDLKELKSDKFEIIIKYLTAKIREQKNG